MHVCKNMFQINYKIFLYVRANTNEDWLYFSQFSYSYWYSFTIFRKLCLFKYFYIDITKTSYT